MNADSHRPVDLGGCATLACLWEAAAAKPGNVYRGADFSDMTFGDFVTSAAVIGPVFNQAEALGLGRLTLHAVRAMMASVGVNTHLGTILLVAPLAKAAHAPGDLFANAGRVARESTVEDARLAYEAIRLAAPGGLGRAPEADVGAAPEIALHDAMALAAERDLVARQYGNGFQEVASLADHIQQLASGIGLADAIVDAHVRQMAAWPDSLIARKCGAEVAQQSAAGADRVIQAGPPRSEAYRQALADLDFWLRSDGHRRNPGTTADLVGAALFCLLAQDRLCWPVRFYGEPL